ncbi:MAG: T9SS C-terminal target domain-containing protein [Ignavibacteriales bacterium]|nr:MAG: T9SS C-terminal target domain-containing protein [Ignavibacteriales bacterium]
MSECSSYDAGPEVRAYFEAQGKTGGLWDYEDTYQSVFRRKVLSQGSLRVKVTKTVSIQIEIAIPKNELAGINLKEGDKIGMNVYYTSVNNQASIRATTFDQYSFAYFTIGNTVDVEENNNLQPSEFSLLQNYPNPFNPATKIKYSIPVGAYSNTPIHNVLLKVYDILGNEVITLVNDEKPAGQYEVLWNEKNNKGNEVSSGIYFYRLDAGAQSLTRKMILVR